MLRLLLFLLLRKEVDTMAVIYATLIVNQEFELKAQGWNPLQENK